MIIIGSREEFNLTEYLPEENDVADYEIAEKYLNYGNQIVIIKHGKKGSVAYGADKEAFKVDSYKIKLLKILWWWRCLCFCIYLWSFRRLELSRFSSSWYSTCSYGCC
mgnify:CR=1 FL=1